MEWPKRIVTFHICRVTQENLPPERGIKWSLRAFASMQAVGLFVRARAVINFLMRAAITL